MPENAQVPGARRSGFGAWRVLSAVGSDVVVRDSPCDQKSRRDFARFLRYSVNSANELEYHITFVRDAGIVTSAEVEERLNAVAEVRKMLTGLIKRIDEDSD